jgi:hypothetical protein
MGEHPRCLAWQGKATTIAKHSPTQAAKIALFACETRLKRTRSKHQRKQRKEHRPKANICWRLRSASSPDWHAITCEVNWRLGSSTMAVHGNGNTKNIDRKLGMANPHRTRRHEKVKQIHTHFTNQGLVYDSDPTDNQFFRRRTNAGKASARRAKTSRP